MYCVILLQHQRYENITLYNLKSPFHMQRWSQGLLISMLKLFAISANSPLRIIIPAFFFSTNCFNMSYKLSNSSRDFKTLRNALSSLFSRFYLTFILYIVYFRMSSPDNDTVPREGESRRGEVRSIRELTSTLSTMRAQSEGGRVLRASCSLIRYIHLIYQTI